MIILFSIYRSGPRIISQKPHNHTEEAKFTAGDDHLGNCVYHSRNSRFCMRSAAGIQRDDYVEEEEVLHLHLLGSVIELRAHIVS